MEAFKINTKEKNNSTTLICEGDLTIRNIKSIQSQLDNARFSKNAIIEIKKIEFLDLCFLQLLIAFVKKLESKKIKLQKIKLDLKEDITDLLEHTGMMHYFKSDENK